MTKEDIYLILVDMLQEMFELDRSKITPMRISGQRFALYLSDSVEFASAAVWCG